MNDCVFMIFEIGLPLVISVKSFYRLAVTHFSWVAFVQALEQHVTDVTIWVNSVPVLVKSAQVSQLVEFLCMTGIDGESKP